MRGCGTPERRRRVSRRHRDTTAAVPAAGVGERFLSAGRTELSGGDCRYTSGRSSVGRPTGSCYRTPTPQETVVVKRNTNGRKPSGTAAIAVIEDPIERDDVADEIDEAPEAAAAAPKRERKTKTETTAEGNF